MTAEYALRKTLGYGSSVHVHSAGIVDAPHEIVDFVRDYLHDRGIDVSAHAPRKITLEMLQNSNIAVVMDLSHQREIAEGFGVRLPLFNEIAYGEETAMPDVWEVVPDWRNNEGAAREYGQSLMARIIGGMPQFIRRMSEFDLRRV